MKNFTLKLSLAFSLFFPILSPAATQLTLIAKCSFSGSHQILANKTYFAYVFGDRSIDKSTGEVQIENFKILHELAVANDNIDDNKTPNLTEDRISRRPVKLGTKRKLRNATFILERPFDVFWKHEAIGGREESQLNNILVYSDEDVTGTPTNGSWSALAYLKNFTGAYPTCRNLKMPAN